jgi:LacI family transcriptional regulator
MKRLTLEDIGRLAGVSRATASRVVNGYPHIRPDVRERVEKVIADTGYRPNAAARSLASFRTNMIGLIVPIVAQRMFDDPYFPVLIQGVANAAGQHGQISSLFLINELNEAKKLADDVIHTGFVDGLILVLGDYNWDSLLRDDHIPFVTIGRTAKAERVHYVEADNEGGGHNATQHLISLGHRRIGIIAASYYPTGQGRLDGYRRALAENRIAFDEKLCVQSDFSFDSAIRAAEQLIPQKPSAIFVSSDLMAAACIQVLNAHGLSVPEDVAVVGFDDLSLAARTSPPLTTVRQHVEQLGRASVELLLKLIEEPEAAHESIVIPTELIVRESCGVRSKNTGKTLKAD